MMRNLLLLLCFLFEAIARTVVLPGTLYYDGVPSFERDPFNYIVAIGGGKVEDVGKTKKVVMTTSEGVQYSCGVPLRKEEATELDEIEEEKSKKIPTKTPFEFLDTLGSSCLFRIEQWWNFEFCYKKKIRQFHDDKDETQKADYTLGQFDPKLEQNKEIQEDVIRGRKRKFVSQLYTDGDICEQNNEPRTAEVRFFCDEQSQWSASAITGIMEGPTCHYVVSVSSPLLCKHPEFKMEETTRVIVCDRLTADDTQQEVDNDVIEKEEEEEEEYEEASHSDDEPKHTGATAKDEL